MRIRRLEFWSRLCQCEVHNSLSILDLPQFSLSKLVLLISNDSFNYNKVTNFHKSLDHIWGPKYVCSGTQHEALTFTYHCYVKMVSRTGRVLHTKCNELDPGAHQNLIPWVELPLNSGQNPGAYNQGKRSLLYDSAQNLGKVYNDFSQLQVRRAADVSLRNFRNTPECGYF